MAINSKILKARDAFLTNITASGWTVYKELTVEAQEIKSFPCIVCTFADQQELTQLSNGKTVMRAVNINLAAIVDIKAYADATTAADTLFTQFETWLNAGTAKAEIIGNIDTIKSVINDRLVYIIAVNLRLGVQ